MAIAPATRVNLTNAGRAALERMRARYQRLLGKAAGALRQPRPALRLAANILARVALVIVALELVYLAAANIVLGGGLLKKWATGDDFVLAYDSAYSIFPGRAHAHNFRLRTSDSNVQIELLIDEVTVDVDLPALWNKRFHALRVRTEGTTFKLRHKLEALGKEGLRVAAYPEISGYEGLPLRTPEDSDESEHDDDEDSWSVRLDDVVAGMEELWFVEYRYRGTAEATGAFELRPGVLFELAPSELTLSGGKLSVGEHVVGSTFTGVLRSTIERTDLEQVKGKQIFERISAAFDGELRGGDLGFLTVYLEPHWGASVSGPLAAGLHAELERGRISRRSKVSVTSSRAVLKRDGIAWRGDLLAMASVARGTKDAALLLELASRELRASGNSAPVVAGFSASMHIQPLMVYEPLEIQKKQLSVERVLVPSLGWFERWLNDDSQRLDGSASMGLTWTRLREKPAVGELTLSLTDFSYADSSVRVSLGAELRSKLEEHPDARLGFKHLHLTVDDVVLASGDERSEVWNATVKSNSLRLLESKPPSLQGTFDVKVDRAKALLPLVLPDLPAKVAASLLGLGVLEARLAVHYASSLKRVEVLQAKSGPLSLEGAWQKSGRLGSGAFLLRTKLTDIGLELKGSDWDVTLGASERFLQDVGPS